MRALLDDATVRGRATALVVLGAVVAVVLPTLLLTASDPAGSVTVSVVALAVASLVHTVLQYEAYGTRVRTAFVRPATRLPQCSPHGSLTRCTTHAAPVLLD